MSTATEKTESDIDLYRLTVSQFETVVDTGVFGDDKVELLGGHLVKLMTSDERHITTVDSVFRALLRLLPETSWYVPRRPVTLSRGMAAIAGYHGSAGVARSYKQEGRKPGPEDVVILVEVSDTTYSKDSGRKLRKYARTGVPGLLDRRHQPEACGGLLRSGLVWLRCSRDPPRGGRRSRRHRRQGLRPGLRRGSPTPGGDGGERGT